MIQPLFEERIRSRHRVFWEDARAEAVRNTRMDASLPIEKWKDVENWQRKLSNKHNAREFAKMHHCRVPQLYWKGRDCAGIDFNALPDQYVIRPTIGHTCNMVFLVNKGVNLFDGQRWPPARIVETLEAALQQNPYLEFLFEEFLRNEEGEYRMPVDYKVYAFNGEIACIDVINRITPATGDHYTYDPSWKPMACINDIWPLSGGDERPPACLDELLDYARRLGRTYGIFVRIDLYATDRGAVFGEFTPTPFLGTGYTQYGSEMLSSYWEKYCPDMI